MISTLLLATAILQDRIELPAYPSLSSATAFKGDPLLQRVSTLSKVYKGPTADEIALDNGLVRRSFRFHPNGMTVGLSNVQSGVNYLANATPAAQITINGRIYLVGGQASPTDQPGSRFQIYQVSVTTLKKPLDWLRPENLAGAIWPPRGMALKLSFANSSLPGVTVTVTHEAYDGLPVLMKQIAIVNSSQSGILLNSYKSEILELDSQKQADLVTLSDYEFTDFTYESKNSPFQRETSLHTDKVPFTSITFKPFGPDIVLNSGQSFTSPRSFLIFGDQKDVDRTRLTIQAFHSALAPWSETSTLTLAHSSTDVQETIDALQLAKELGFEQLLFQRYSGIDMTDAGRVNIGKFKGLAFRAHELGLKIAGGYQPRTESIPKSDLAEPGIPCLDSEWFWNQTTSLQQFVSATNFDGIREMLGYSGSRCTSKNHKGHAGSLDSQWAQWSQIAGLHKNFRLANIDIASLQSNLLSGATDVIVKGSDTPRSIRENLAAASRFLSPKAIQPLLLHIGEGSSFEQALMTYLGYGIGPIPSHEQITSHPERVAFVKAKIAWFKQYRDILESPTVILPDNDVLHVNRKLVDKGMAVFYNDTDQPISKTVTVPLYFTGIRSKVKVSVNGGNFTLRDLTGSNVTFPLTIPPSGYVWVRFRQG